MSIIEQAVKRLEELRRAGVDVPTSLASAPRVDRVARAGVGSSDGSRANPAARGLQQNAGAKKTSSIRRSSRPEGTRATSRQVELDLMKLAESGYLASPTADRRLADEFRVIKLHVLRGADLALAQGRPRGNIVLVTSSMPGEGKTFTSINLALSIASQVDQSVLLVDGDVLRPAVSERLGIQTGLGLTDLLSQPELPLADILLKTNVPKFSLISAGSSSERSAELLGSAAMEDLLEELAQRYPDRFIVVDGPPLLISTISRSLASRVGQVLMVVEAESSRRGIVTQALTALDGCPNVQVVLNKSSLPAAGSDYGYYGTR